MPVLSYLVGNKFQSLYLMSSFAGGSSTKRVRQKCWSRSTKFWLDTEVMIALMSCAFYVGACCTNKNACVLVCLLLRDAPGHEDQLMVKLYQKYGSGLDSSGGNRLGRRD
jgi:hypothetical protein